MYRMFRTTTGITYTTRDNWNSIDSTAPFISNPDGTTPYTFYYCNFGRSDTIFAYGFHQLASFKLSPYIARTTDAGQHWVSVYDDTMVLSGYVHCLSGVNRDTLVAGITGYPNVSLLSNDRGATWDVDSLTYRDTNFIEEKYTGIGLNAEGNLVAAFDGPGYTSLVIGRHALSGVAASDMKAPAVQVFPNPAITSVTVTNELPERTVRVLDLLGREVLRGVVPPNGTLTLDVSSLPTDLYFVSDGISRVKFVKE
jgi:hypothetical protein